MNKAFSEYVERYAYRSDDFSKNHGFDSSGYSAFPKRMFNTKSYDVVRKHSFNEAVERYAILKFWHDFDIDYRTCQEDNFQLIFPILNDSILSVCIAIQDFGATGVAVGFSCNESIKKATCKAKSECISHAIASNLMLSGLHSDNDLYEKRLRYLISNGRHCYDDRLKHKGKKVIRLPKVEISREVKCKEFDSYCVHQIRLKGQDNFLDDRFVEVGYL